MDLSNVFVALKGLHGATGATLYRGPGALTPQDLFGKAYNEATDFQITKVDLDSDLFKSFPPYEDGEGAGAKITEYKFQETASMRVRRPTHVAAKDSEYMEKYKTAVRKLKGLPDDDPFDSYRQAKIIWDSPTTAYDQVDMNMIFLSGQRNFLYFYERVLGELIEDETFALPYWDFDGVDGMTLPSIFLDETSVSDIFSSDSRGAFYTSGRDALFYGLHANVDRMWDVYTKTVSDTTRYDDPEWLNAAYYFYDVDRQPVKVQVVDLGDTMKFSYTYATSSSPPWFAR